MQRRHGYSDGPDGLQEINRENEATRFDEALTGYFRVPNTTTTTKRTRGGQRAAPVAETDTSSVCLKQLKRIIRDAAAPQQSQYIQRVHATVVSQFSWSKEIVVFSRAVALCRELFQRSAAFRSIITKHPSSFFDRLLRAAGEDPSAKVSRKLRARNRGSKQLTMALALIEEWTQDFGERYPSLVAGHSVLTQRGYVFPRERERRREEREVEMDTLRHRERVSSVKKQQRDREMAQFVPEMEQVLVEMNRVFEILVPTLDAFQIDGEEEEEVAQPDAEAPAAEEEKQADVEEDEGDAVQWEAVAEPSATGVGADTGEEDGVEWESVADEEKAEGSEEDAAEDRMDINDIVQAYGLGSSSYQLTIEVSKQVCEESEDNEALFRSLADGALRMRKRFLPLLGDWEQYSTLVGSSPSSPAALQSQREVLQRIRDLRDRMTRALLKWDDLVQGAEGSKRRGSTRSAVVSLPLDAYDPPAKRSRQSRTQAE